MTTPSQLKRDGTVRRKEDFDQEAYSMKLNRDEPDHPHWKKPFSHKESAAAWWGLGACSIALGLQECFDPSQAPFSGRWSWIKTMAFNAMGHYGPAIVYLGLGSILVAAGCLKWSQYLAQKRA